uniref:Uncharacterized protein n=1 Tax=Anopheles melas TaxID=34690 RepID=A0A182TK82_9DIPT
MRCVQAVMLPMARPIASQNLLAIGARLLSWNSWISSSTSVWWGGVGARISGAGRSSAGLSGSTELASCRHTGQKNSPSSTFRLFGLRGVCSDLRYASWQDRCTWWPQDWMCTPPSQPMLCDRNQDVWPNFHCSSSMRLLNSLASVTLSASRAWSSRDRGSASRSGRVRRCPTTLLDSTSTTSPIGFVSVLGPDVLQMMQSYSFSRSASACCSSAAWRSATARAAAAAAAADSPSVPAAAAAPVDSSSPKPKSMPDESPPPPIEAIASSMNRFCRFANSSIIFFCRSLARLVRSSFSRASRAFCSACRSLWFGHSSARICSMRTAHVASSAAILRSRLPMKNGPSPMRESEMRPRPRCGVSSPRLLPVGVSSSSSSIFAWSPSPLGCCRCPALDGDGTPVPEGCWLLPLVDAVLPPLLAAAAAVSSSSVSSSSEKLSSAPLSCECSFSSSEMIDSSSTIVSLSLLPSRPVGPPAPSRVVISPTPPALPCCWCCWCCCCCCRPWWFAIMLRRLNRVHTGSTGATTTRRLQTAMVVAGRLLRQRLRPVLCTARSSSPYSASTSCARCAAVMMVMVMVPMVMVVMVMLCSWFGCCGTTLRLPIVPTAVAAVAAGDEDDDAAAAAATAAAARLNGSSIPPVASTAPAPAAPNTGGVRARCCCCCCGIAISCPPASPPGTGTNSCRIISSTPVGPPAGTSSAASSTINSVARAGPPALSPPPVAVARMSDPGPTPADG